jgi:hypothetical protein
MLIDHDARTRGVNKLRQPVLAMLNRRAAQILALKFDQVEGTQHRGVAKRGNRDVKSWPLRENSRTPALSRRARMRKPSCLIS